jgi:hypothetical protein
VVADKESQFIAPRSGNLLPTRGAVVTGSRREDAAVKLLDEVRRVARLRRFALETERCYARWIEQFIRFHKSPAGFRRPNAMGADEIERFLSHLAVQRP